MNEWARCEYCGGRSFHRGFRGWECDGCAAPRIHPVDAQPLALATFTTNSMASVQSAKDLRHGLINWRMGDPSYRDTTLGG